MDFSLECWLVQSSANWFGQCLASASFPPALEVIELLSHFLATWSLLRCSPRRFPSDVVLGGTQPSSGNVAAVRGPMRQSNAQRTDQKLERVFPFKVCKLIHRWKDFMDCPVLRPCRARDAGLQACKEAIVPRREPLRTLGNGPLTSWARLPVGIKHHVP